MQAFVNYLLLLHFMQIFDQNKTYDKHNINMQMDFNATSS
jgi:hypothetical protein